MSKLMKRQRKPLNPREELLARLMVQGKSVKEASKSAGYVSTATAYKPKIRERVTEIFDSMGLTNSLITKKLMEGLDATKIVGTKDDFIEVPDYLTRHKYIETILKLQDQYPSERHKVEIDTVEARLQRLYGQGGGLGR